MDREGNFVIDHRTLERFSLNQIFDGAELFEAEIRSPRFFPRVRLGSLYRRHVATTLILEDPDLSVEETVDAETLYSAGLRRLKLKPGATSEGAYPAQPLGWEKRKHDGLTWTYERLDVWLAIAPDDRTDNLRPALLFNNGDSQTTAGDVWRAPQANSNYGLYVDTINESEDVNNDWSSMVGQASSDPEPAVILAADPAAIIDPLTLARPGASTGLELRVQVPRNKTIIWIRAAGGALFRFINPDLENYLFQSCFFFNNMETDYQLASDRPCALNDTPIFIRRFIDPEIWSPSPSQSVGGALLRNLLGDPRDSVLGQLDASAKALRAGLDKFNVRGRKDFDDRYKSRLPIVEATSQPQHHSLDGKMVRIGPSASNSTQDAEET
jgi:hypothetical protein